MRNECCQSWDKGEARRALAWLLPAALVAVGCMNDGRTGDAPSAAIPMPASASEPGSTEEMSAPATDDDDRTEQPPATEPAPADPEMPAVYAAALEEVASCEDAEKMIRERAIAAMNKQLDTLRGQWKTNVGCPTAAFPGALPAGGPMAMATPPPSAPSASSGSADSASTSGGARSTSMTNNQVAGVDEADIIKNDAKYMYAAVNGALRIIEAWPAAQAREVAKVELEGTPKKLFVLDDRALVYVSVPRMAAAGNPASDRAGAPLRYAGRGECTYGYDCEFGGDGTATALLVFDIADRSAPKQVRRIDLSGSLLAARRIGSAVHTVAVTPELVFPGVMTYLPGQICGASLAQEELDRQLEQLRTQNIALIESTDLGDFLPQVREDDTDYAANDCDSLYRELAPTGTAFTSVVSVDLKTNDAPVVSTVLSKPGAVYASGEALYMAVIQDGFSALPAASSDARKLGSKIHKFRIGSDPKATTYAASGTVKGHVLNQFSMDEHAGHLRVATSYGRVPSPNVHSTISVLGQSEHALVQVGIVDDIAPSEDIRSVRFNGDRGFVVTFKKTDPLYAFDLSKPAAPRITGELKIPGFSTYMHMLDEQHLLTIGYDAADQGEFAFFTGVLLQIFDVRDPAQPKLAHKTVIGTRGSSSEALTNHLAFNLFEGKLAVPMTICEGGDTNGQAGTRMTFSGLMVFDVGVDTGIHERGRVAHPGAAGSYDDVGCSSWWTRASSVVQRSVFMEDFVYSVALDVIRVQDLGMLGKDVAAVALTE